MDRVTFGISELDSALSGGLPKGNLVLLSGGAGTGKSTLCLHYLVSGALNGERGLYISTEQDPVELSRQCENCGLDFKNQVEKDNVRVMMVDILKEEGWLQKIREEVESFSPQRIVIDSLSTFSEYASATDIARDILIKRGGIPVRTIDEIAPSSMSERTMVKRMLAMLMSEMKSFKATALLTSELPEKGDSLSSDGVSEFLADGVITLYYLGIGSARFRTMQIRKMRYSSHEMQPISYSITDRGIIVVKDKPFM